MLGRWQDSSQLASGFFGENGGRTDGKVKVIAGESEPPFFKGIFYPSSIIIDVYFRSLRAPTAPQSIFARFRHSCASFINYF